MTFKMMFTVCLVLALGAIPLFADVSGSPLLDYGTLDHCTGCIFPIIQFTAANAGQSVKSYSFFAGTANLAESSYDTSVTSNFLTPILFEETSGSLFTILGIGAPSSGFVDLTINTRPFVLSAGSATVLDASTFFGYVDGKASGSANTGTISMNYPSGTGPVKYFHDYVGALTVGQSITMTSLAGIGQGTRTYALQVTTPEPGFYGILAVFALCLTGLFATVGRRKNA